MKRKFRKSLFKTVVLLFVICSLLTFHGTAAESANTDTISLTYTNDKLEKIQDIDGTYAHGVLWTYDNYATGQITYNRTSEIKVTVNVITGFGTERYERSATATAPGGWTQCVAGTQSIISSQLLYARADYSVSVKSGTGSLSWSDYNEWGDKDLQFFFFDQYLTAMLVLVLHALKDDFPKSL